MEQGRTLRDLLVEVARIFLFVVGLGFVIVVGLGAVLFALASLLMPIND